jgi:isopropylmalate/homocitrate/citramalate synthase
MAVANSLAAVRVGARHIACTITGIGERVRIQHEENVYSGQSANTDVVVASARAYVNALNRLKVHRADVGSNRAKTQV